MIKLLRYLKRYRVQSVLAPVFKMIEAALELVVPLVIARIIDEGIDKEQPRVILSNCFLLAVFAFVGLILAVLAQYFASGAAVGFASEIRRALFEKVLNLPACESDKLGSNKLITVLTGDVERVQTGVNMVLRLFMRSPVVVFGAVIMAFVTDRRGAGSAGWIFVAIVPLLAAAIFSVMLLGVKLYGNARSDAEDLTLELRENLTGVRVFRSFGQEENRLERLKERNNRTFKSSVRAGTVSALTGPFTLVIVNLGVIALLYTGALRVENGLLTAGQLVALYNYMSQILVELVKLANLIVTVTKSFASGNRIAAVLEPECAMERIPENTVLKASGNRIVFEHVSMTYPDGTRALEDVSFSLKKGTSLGIIGGTGAGKSTVVSLLMRFYDPTGGKIFYDGQDLKSLDERALRRKMGVALQKAELFKGTVRENLLWGKDDATEEELWKALEISQAKEVVKEKTGGLDEPMEQFGNNFSGGQKQRLTVARALVRRPEVLILDDSASALDYATDRAMRHAVSQLSYRPTLVVVSQRASSVMHLDNILVLDNGRVVGFGSHEALLESCGVYREIYRSQFGGGDLDEKS